MSPKGIFDFCQPYLDELQNKAKGKGRELCGGDVIRFIKKDPIAFIKLQIKKFFLFWSYWDHIK